MTTSHLILLVIGWCIVHFLMLRFLNMKALRIVSTLSTILWAVAVLFLTTFSRTPVLETRIQLIPFAGQNAYGVDQTIRGMIENAVMFFPLGGLLLGMFLQMKPWLAIAIGAGTSILIELVQLIAHRGITATEDMVANTIGCALGVLVTLGIRQLAKRA